jgi:lipopolysaccharide export LptBFGC system permease protein LptF
MDQLTVYGIALVPVMVGLAELLKRFGLPPRFIPLATVLMGLFFSFYYLAPGEPKKAILFGTVLGLSAIGLFSGAKNTFVSRKR